MFYEMDHQGACVSHGMSTPVGVILLSGCNPATELGMGKRMARGERVRRAKVFCYHIRIGGGMVVLYMPHT